MNQVIIGRGEVGKALRDNLIGEISSFDKNEWEHFGEGHYICDILHICIPYSEKFIEIVESALKIFKTTALVIHSTVKPGTTNKIDFKCKVYSPFNGRHDDSFSDNTRLYPKFFAGDEQAYNIVSHQGVTKFNTQFWGYNIEELEFAKISCTNYMYWNLVFSNAIYNECEQKGYDFKNVYERWNKYYNIGIATLHYDWRRPIYEHKEGLPGGHCLRPNIHLNDDVISKSLRAYESAFEKEDKKEIV